MLDDGLTINLNLKFWYSISGISKPATHAGHGYDNFHNELKKIFLSLRSRIKELEKEKPSKKEGTKNLKELQMYYCYVYRELEVRKIV